MSWPSRWNPGGAAGHTVEVCRRDGLVLVTHGGVVIATQTRRHPREKEPAVLRHQPQGRPARPSTSGPTVIRKVDSGGGVSFAGTGHRVGNAHRRRQVQVAVVGDSVQISLDGPVIRTDRAVHDSPRSTPPSPRPAAGIAAATPNPGPGVGTYRGH
jgi:hypothetical protein